MAIDTLNQLQAERGRLTRHPEASAMPARAGSVVPPRFPVATLRKSLRLSLIVCGLVASLWGWPVLGDTGGVDPEHETDTGKVHRADNTPSRLVAGVPVQKTEEISVAVSLADAAGEGATPTENAPPTGVEAKRDAIDLSIRPTQSVRQRPLLDASPSPISAALDFPRVNTESNLATQARPSVAEDAPVQTPQPAPDVPSSSEEPFVVNATAETSSQQDPIVRPRPRIATPLEDSLADARDLITQRRYAQAMTVLSPLFATPPHSWEPWFWLGTAQLGLGQWEEARESFMGGLARDATAQLWVHHALASQQLDRPGEALESLRQAEMLAPQLPEVQLNLAYSLEMEGATPVAVEHYRMFLALTKDNKVYDGIREKVRRHLVRLATR